uniref:Uncharacterized protein n=1 Tax=Trichogramma kaykai TaxID=54128 RepID=A0ABD2X895_9HYME
MNRDDERVSVHERCDESFSTCKYRRASGLLYKMKTVKYKFLTRVIRPSSSIERINKSSSSRTREAVEDAPDALHARESYGRLLHIISLLLLMPLLPFICKHNESQILETTRRKQIFNGHSCAGCMINFSQHPYIHKSRQTQYSITSAVVKLARARYTYAERDREALKSNALDFRGRVELKQP